MDVDRAESLHIPLVRAMLARSDGRIRRPVAASFAVTGARVAELILAGLICDSEGLVAVTEVGAARTRRDPFTARVMALAGCGWDQLFLRTGLEPAQLLRDALEGLVADGTLTIRSGRWRQPEHWGYHDATYPRPITAEPFHDRPVGIAERAVLGTLYLLETPQMFRPLWFDSAPTRLIEHIPGIDKPIRDALVQVAFWAVNAENIAHSSSSIRFVR